MRNTLYNPSPIVFTIIIILFILVLVSILNSKNEPEGITTETFYEEITLTCDACSWSSCLTTCREMHNIFYEELKNNSAYRLHAVDCYAICSE